MPIGTHGPGPVPLEWVPNSRWVSHIQSFPLGSGHGGGTHGLVLALPVAIGMLALSARVRP